LNELTFWDYIGFGKVITVDIKSGNKPIAPIKNGETGVFSGSKSLKYK
jgi:hypothetical protein